MKNKNLFSYITILFVFAIFTSCSKDSSIIQSKDSVSNTGISEKSGPVYSSGVMGYLTPAPIRAEIKIYIVDRLSYQIPVNPDGTFKSSYIPPGFYNMLIAYVDGNWLYFEMNNVEILADNFTDLGQIKLP